MDNNVRLEQEAWLSRAACCELLALSFRYPDEQFAHVVASGEWRQASIEVFSCAGCELPESFDDQVLCCEGRDAGEVLLRLRREYSRLFSGLPYPKIVPYQNGWLARRRNDRYLLFVNPEAMAVERVFAVAGIKRLKDEKESFDFVSLELECLMCLALMNAGVMLAPKGEDPYALWIAFLQDHIDPWMAGFARDVSRETKYSLYKEAACLLEVFVGVVKVSTPVR